MKKLIVLGLLMITTTVFSQDLKISINKLTEETQQLSESADNLKLVWWIPIEFWQAVFNEDKTMPKNQADEIIQVLGQYTMLATLDGKISDFGDVSYQSKDQIFNTLSITDNNNQVYTPLEDSEIDQRTKDILSFMKPVLGSMMGKLGDNMHFFLFKNTNNPIERIINPKNEDTFTVKLGDEEFKWTLPLSSLIRPKKCPVDGALLNGTWNYCPYHGNELIKH